MRMFKWISSRTIKVRITNADIRDNLGVTPNEDKIGENHLRWFVHVDLIPEHAIWGQTKVAKQPLKEKEEDQKNLVRDNLGMTCRYVTQQQRLP